ncbi:MAG: NAD-dependent epimerase/dehydratase family protein [Gammaproteobacteria bacterium]
MRSIANPDDLIVVTGGGGFIGGHLLKHFIEQGFTRLRSVDIKPLEHWFQVHPQVDNVVADLRELPACQAAAEGAVHVFNLACDMGGMGFIESHKADCMLSVLINTHMLMAARDVGAKRFLYSSSACVYAHDKQTDTDNPGLREADAYPAMPEDGYGWEKLFSERMSRHFTEDYQLATRVARYHNVYGPEGSWDGGREKAPAAICRKVIQAKLSGNHEIEIWGDGEQTRSFMYIDDCLEGTLKLMTSDVGEPLNIGSDQMVTINQLVDIAESIAGIKLNRSYKLDAPLGVRGRNSDNTLVQEKLGWKPTTRLEDGLELTYRWIYDEIVAGKRSLS